MRSGRRGAWQTGLGSGVQGSRGTLVTSKASSLSLVGVPLQQNFAISGFRVSGSVLYITLKSAEARLPKIYQHPEGLGFCSLVFRA